MSLLTRLFPGLAGPSARLDRARRLVERGEYNDARWALDGVDGPEAEALRAEATLGLAHLNLDEARARFLAGDPEGGAEHLEMARQFGAAPDDLRSVRRAAREAREAARVTEEALPPPNVELQGNDPLWSLPPDDPRLRFAVLVESYPDDLRERLAALGAGFAEAVLLIEAGDPRRAHEALSEYVSREPAARYERARAALEAGLLPAAASDLQAFVDALGHHRIGGTHTAILLAQVLGQLGRVADALEVVERALDAGPEPALMAHRASLLEALGRLDEAEDAVVATLAAAPKAQGMYRLLGRVRLARGNRLGAMQALEAGLSHVCSTPGKCGFQPLDLDAVRMLTVLYLEDRREPKRVEELLEELRRHVTEPTFDDRYIQALVARNAADPATPALAERLIAEVGTQDRRAQRVRQAFAISV